MTSVAEGAAPSRPPMRPVERVKRYEFNVSFLGQFGIVAAAFLVVAVKLLSYGYGDGNWAVPSHLFGLSKAEIKNVLGIASIVFEGAATAALLSITIAVVLRIDVYKIVDRIINAPPTLLDPDTVDRLARIREAELTEKIDELTHKNDTLTKQLGEAKIRMEGLQGRLEGDRNVFEKLASALTQAANDAKTAGTSSR
jgi:hypothetical protein